MIALNLLITGGFAMRHFGKRAFALFLALMLCLSLFPSALAEDAGSIAAEDAPEQEVTIAPAEEGDIAPAEEGTIAPAEEGSIRPAEEGDALPRTDETQDGETSGQCGENLTWSFDETTGTLTITGSGDMWDWDYPAQVAPWYSLRGSIKSVALPRGLTSIGSCAFFYCSGLTKVDIPAGVTSIGQAAFYYCSGLTSVTIPAGVTSIGSNAFSYCSGLTGVTIPEGVTSISNYAFSSCSGLTGVTIPVGVTSIGHFAFSSCSGLTSVEIPNTVRLIGEGAFTNCTGLTSVFIREGTESIMDKAFSSCSKLSSVMLPGSLTYLSSNAFSVCSGLKELYFGGTVEAWKALQASYDLTKVTVYCADGDLLPASAEQCGDDLTWSFDESSGTLTITGSGDMWDCQSGSFAPWDSLRDSIKSVELPRGLTSIGNAAFTYCRKLTSVDIPTSVTSIGSNAFSHCSGLTSIEIPVGVTSIGNWAFDSCSGLTGVTIPGSVTSIGARAFQNCSGLTEVTISEGVVIIWGAVFYNCSGLTSITIPASATEINTYLLSGCQNLKDVYYAGTCEVWRGLNLAYDRGSVTVHCADGVISPNTDANRCGDDLFWSLENGILTISGTGDMWNYDIYQDSTNRILSTAPWYAQRNLITQIHLAEGVTGIGDYAFGAYMGYSDDTYCKNLVSVELPETLQRIGDGGFGGCSALKEVRLPGALKEIGFYALAGCGFTELALPESLETIGSGAFFNAKIRSLTVPASVTQIGDYAFRSSSLSEIRFLGNAPGIDGAAFYGKTVTAYYPQNNPTWAESVKRSYGGVITWEPYLPTGGTLRLGDATACAGKAFTLDLSLEENPGIMGLSFQLDYDSAVMEFVGAEEGVLTGWTVNVKKNILVWDDDREHTENGCLLKLKFRLKEDAAPGETRIGLTDLTVGNYNEDNLYFRVRSGRVTVLVHRPGDANGDGKVNVNDLIRLRKYLAGVEKEIIAGNADVNADEVVDILDLVRLRKYIAQVDGVILE